MTGTKKLNGSRFKSCDKSILRVQLESSGTNIIFECEYIFKTGSKLTRSFNHSLTWRELWYHTTCGSTELLPQPRHTRYGIFSSVASVAADLLVMNSCSRLITNGDMTWMKSKYSFYFCWLKPLCVPPSRGCTKKQMSTKTTKQLGNV